MFVFIKTISILLKSKLLSFFPEVYRVVYCMENGLQSQDLEAIFSSPEVKQRWLELEIWLKKVFDLLARRISWSNYTRGATAI